MKSRSALYNIVVKFESEQLASTSWQAGAITGGTPPTEIGRTMADVQTGRQTGLGDNSWTLVARDGTATAAWSINKYNSILAVWGGGLKEMKDLATKVRARESAQQGTSASSNAQASTNSSSASPTPKVTANKAMAGHGLLACSDFDSLILIDPKSGSTIATAPVSAKIPTGWSAGYYCPDRNRGLDGAERVRLREQFSPDLSRVAVYGSQADGSQHVGYVDLATGLLTDLTAKHQTTGFGSTLPVHCNPLFAPSSNTFWFLEAVPNRDRSTVHRVDLTTGAEETRGTVDLKCPNIYAQILVWASDQVAALPTFPSYAALPNPTGTLAVSRPVGPGMFAGFSLFVSPSGPPTRVSMNGGKNDCQPYAWADDSTLICATQAGGDWILVVASSVTASTTSAQATPLLPTNTRRNYSPVTSPDAKTVAFASQQGTDISLYTIALANAGAEPTLVAANMTFSLISWQ
jgi:hypothetical protein